MKPTGDPDPCQIELEPGVQLWAEHLSALARSKMSGTITALVSVYTRASSTYLAVDMIGAHRGDMSVTLLTGQLHNDYRLNDLESTCFDVVDLVHAQRMASALLNALGIQRDHLFSE